MSHRAWFDALAAGDAVVVVYPGGPREPRVARVERVESTHRECVRVGGLVYRWHEDAGMARSAPGPRCRSIEPYVPPDFAEADRETRAAAAAARPQVLAFLDRVRAETRAGTIDPGVVFSLLALQKNMEQREK